MTNQSVLPKEKKNPKPGIRLTGNQKSWLISAHVISGAIWFSTTLSIVVIVVSNFHTKNGDELYGNSLVKLLKRLNTNGNFNRKFSSFTQL